MISWLLFELLLNDWKFVVTNGLLLYTFLIFVQQEAICCNKFSVNQQLIKDGWRYLLEIFSICSSPDCAKLTKKFRPLLNQPASHGPFWPKFWTALETMFVEIFFFIYFSLITCHFIRYQWFHGISPIFSQIFGVWIFTVISSCFCCDVISKQKQDLLLFSAVDFLAGFSNSEIWNPFPF